MALSPIITTGPNIFQELIIVERPQSPCFCDIPGQRFCSICGTGDFFTFPHMRHKVSGRTDTDIIVTPKIINCPCCSIPGTDIHVVAENKTPVVFGFIGCTCPWAAAVVVLRIVVVVDVALTGLIPYIGIHVGQKIDLRYFYVRTPVQ